MGAWGRTVETIKRIRRIRDRWVRDNASSICHQGCSGCCRQEVGTLIVEGASIAMHAVHLERDPRKVIEFKSRLEARAGSNPKTHGCMFLDEFGACTIYDIRPASCSTLFPLGARCDEKTKSKDNVEPLHAARDLDERWCKAMGLTWYPGPLRLPKAIEVGSALLAKGAPFAESLITQADILPVKRIRR